MVFTGTVCNAVMASSSQILVNFVKLAGLLCRRLTGGGKEPESMISLILIDISVSLSAKKAAKPLETHWFSTASHFRRPLSEWSNSLMTIHRLLALPSVSAIFVA